MAVKDDDPAFAIRFKIAFPNDFDTRLEYMNILWLKLSTSLDRRCKNLKYVQKCERDNIWLELHNLVLNTDSAGQFLTRSSELPAKSRRFCDLSNSDDDSGNTQSYENLLVCRYRSEPRVDDNECQLQWWKKRKGSYTALVIIARKYVCIHATSVRCEKLFSFQET
ncbi:hypothetical protein RF11_07327 [Thelohanellus kitauei]|uniref:HAT C-terminal dimerisation domain-containing protein n=1 Tax=Thelohanellus kitauei TaxID=669202 RepID=A0A0C2MU66_THEKT|nr:hypothetical protein RF11_07327 [Thelohanellus kitauei]